MIQEKPTSSTVIIYINVHRFHVETPQALKYMPLVIHNVTKLNNRFVL